MLTFKGVAKSLIGMSGKSKSDNKGVINSNKPPLPNAHSHANDISNANLVGNILSRRRSNSDTSSTHSNDTHNTYISGVSANTPAGMGFNLYHYFHHGYFLTLKAYEMCCVCALKFLYETTLVSIDGIYSRAAALFRRNDGVTWSW